MPVYPAIVCILSYSAQNNRCNKGFNRSAVICQERCCREASGRSGEEAETVEKPPGGCELDFQAELSKAAEGIVPGAPEYILSSVP